MENKIEVSSKLVTIKKILAYFVKENRLISKTDICRNLVLMPKYVSGVIEYLISEGKIEEVESSNFGRFYKIKNGK